MLANRARFSSGSKKQDYFVQRGELSILDTTTTTTVLLDKPVPVGNSFVTITHSTNGSPHVDMPIAYLSNVSGGNYTRITFQSYPPISPDGRFMYISWEVVTSKKFNVQSGVTQINAGFTGASVTINNINLQNSFVVCSSSGDYFFPNRMFHKCVLTNSNTLFISRHTGDRASRVSWQIVSWDGANVQAGEASTGGSSINVTINEIEPNKSFALINFSSSISASGDAGAYVGACLIAPTSISLRRSNNNGVIYFSYFIIEHEDLNCIHYNGVPLASSLEVNQEIPQVDLTKTFLPAQQLGQMRSSATSGFTAPYFLTKRTLTSSTNVRISRESSSSTHVSSQLSVVSFN